MFGLVRVVIGGLSPDFDTVFLGEGMGGWTAIDDFLGEVGTGTCSALFVAAENGNEYIAKGPTLSPSMPHIAANELVAARLAERLGLPVLDTRVLRHGNTYFVGSNRLTTGKFHDFIDQELFNSCENSDHVYLMVVFDIWVCNYDRHERNLMARCRGNEAKARKRCGWDSHTMLCNDHSHCFLCGPVAPSHFASLLNRDRMGEFVQIPFIRGAVRDAELLRQAVCQAEAIGNEDIDSIVEVQGQIYQGEGTIPERSATVAIL